MVAISNGYRMARQQSSPADALVDLMHQHLSELQRRVERLERKNLEQGAAAKQIEETLAARGHEEALRLVCALWGVVVDDLKGPCRAIEFAAPRQAFMLLCRRHCKHLSLPQVGRILNRDHTTVLHGLRKAKERIERDALFAELFAKADAALTLTGATNG